MPLERRLAKFVLPRVPRWLETYHLTLLTPVWSILIVVFGYLAAKDLRWLWMVNLMIVFHYFTDHFDGKLGKFRNTGLRKWGFYMDHLFDYGFLCSILIGYSFLLPQRAIFNMMLVLCVFSAFMFHTFLMLAATEEFKVSFSVLGRPNCALRSSLLTRFNGQVWHSWAQGLLALGRRMWHCSSCPPCLSSSEKTLENRYAGQGSRRSQSSNDLRFLGKFCNQNRVSGV